MKKTIFKGFAVATLIIAAAACQKAEFEGGNAPGGSSENLVPMTITASLETGTKAALQEGGKVFWESGDSMTVLAVANVDGTETVNSYAFGTSEAGEKVDFSNKTGVTLSDSYYAVYPAVHKEYCPYLFSQYYDSKGNYVGVTGFEHTYSEGSIQMFMPSTQFATADASGLDALCAGVVKTYDDETLLNMKNVGGLIAITLPNQNITSVTIYGNSGEIIAGRVTASFQDDGIPVISEVSGSNTIHLIPSAKDGTFTAGTYYINVPPVVFSNGLTLLLTNDIEQFAVLRSSDSFTVERSKISEFPAISDLSFGGKFIEWQFIDDYTIPGGSSGALKYYKDGNVIALPSSSGSAIEGVNKLTDGTYDIKVNATVFANGGSNGGFCFGTKAGCYMTLPVIEGFALSKVAVRSGLYKYLTTSGLCLTTVPDEEGTYETLTNCYAWPGNVQGGMEYIWSVSGEEGQEYALTLTSNTPAQSCRIQVFRLYYVNAPAEGAPSVTPLITDIRTNEPEVDYSKATVTMSASFSAVDYSSLSQFTCGFDYKLSSDSEWTSVSAEEAAFEFTKEVTLDTRGEYIYKSWVKFIKKDGSAKTVYSGEAKVDLSRIVLNLVFDDAYYTNGVADSKGNFLTREWEWKANANNSTEKRGTEMNNQTYNFKHFGNDYPFTFFSVQQASYKDANGVTCIYYGGYTLRVVSKSFDTYGLCMCYLNPNNDYELKSFPAWMQMPGVENFKLVNIKGTQYTKFKFTIADQVDATTGAASGNELATSNIADFDVTLSTSQTNKRYYLCTTGTWNCVFRNMTLTYEYAGE